MGRGKKYYHRGKKRKYGGKSYEINTTAHRRLVLVSVQHGKEGQAQRDLVCAFEETLDILYPNLPALPAPKKLQKNVVPSEREERQANSTSSSTKMDASKRLLNETENNVTEDQGPSKKRVKLSSADDASMGFAGAGDALEKERKEFETPHVQYIRGPMGMVILDFPSKDVDPVKMTVETLKRYVTEGIRPTRWAFKFFPLVTTCYVKMELMQKLAVSVVEKHIEAISPFQEDSLSAESKQEEVKQSTSSTAKSKTTASNWKKDTTKTLTDAGKSADSVGDKQCEVTTVTSTDEQRDDPLLGGQPEDKKPIKTQEKQNIPNAELPIASKTSEVKQDSEQEQNNMPEVKQDSKQDQSDTPEVKKDSKQKQFPESKPDKALSKPEITKHESNKAEKQGKDGDSTNQTSGACQKEVTYFIDYKKRSNSSVHREEILKMLMDLLPGHWKNRWKGKTDWVVVFQILGKTCGMSIVKGTDWHGLGSFNMTKMQKIRDEEQNIENPGSTDL